MDGVGELGRPADRALRRAPSQTRRRGARCGRAPRRPLRRTAARRSGAPRRVRRELLIVQERLTSANEEWEEAASKLAEIDKNGG